MFKKSFLVVAGILLLFVGYLVWQAKQSESNDPTMTHSRTELPACPDKPNCVSTQATDDAHRAQPIPYTGGMEAAKQKLLGVLDGLPRTKRITDEGGYLHYTFKTWPIPFIDDVEFLFDDDAKLIHYRSASRVGHSDLGVNAKRMAKIVTAYAR